MADSTINTLQKFSVKPYMWMVHANPDNTYTIKYSYSDPQTALMNWESIITARGQEKEYKTMNAVMADIHKVTPNPLVQFHLHIVILNHVKPKIQHKIDKALNR